ncbi:MAG: hypothetical protein Aurels2KO_27700 [Aureliella sp.]
MSKTNRRTALKSLGVATAAASSSSLNGAKAAAAAAETPDPNASTWHLYPDRVWLGGDYWANPMENWRVKDGGIECQSLSSGRNVHWITKRCADPLAGFSTTITVRQLEESKKDGGAGFRIGARSDIDEVRSNAFASSGVEAGLRDGKLFIGRKNVPVEIDVRRDTTLTLSGTQQDGKVALKLVALQRTETAGELVATVAADDLVGNVCIVNNFPVARAKRQGSQGGSRYRFTDWKISGDGIEHQSKNVFGPLLWSMYTLSDSRSDSGFILKLSALTGPLGKDDNQQVQLYVRRDTADWTPAGTAELDTDAWVATFTLANWDKSSPADYRLTYTQKHTDGSEETSDWTGTIRANPVGRPLRMAAMTCQKDYAFPYEPVANNVKSLSPDIVYFSGDQLYEGHGGFGIIREPAEPAILNYLRKFYMFGWAFRDCMRDAPTVCIPDDHDVFQGNIWGEGGARMKNLSAGASSKGGYREPARMVNAVHRTNASHHPAPYDASPVKQGISVYYGELIYGNVSFAILSDRQFKSGPERVETGSGRADHVLDPAFDCSALDKPGLVLLGERQEAFLEAWANDWRGHELKCILSQTVFAGVATHHGGYDGYLKADLDCGGWPQTARNRAIKILAPAKALHINGDQHLTSLCQYGVDKQRDSFWSFCTPAIAAGYPRWWRPDEVGMTHENRPTHGIANTGEYTDGLGNLVYVYAVGNPEVGKKKNRYELAHQKGSGFGLVTFDTAAKTYFIECFRFHSDPKSGKPADQFPGWPVTIKQQENAGENLIC